jgi:cation transport regulator ChaC
VASAARALHGRAVSERLVWYFAYGSNLSPAIFVDRRGMRPRAARSAVLDGYRLCFDIPVGPGERGVANVVAAAGARTHGVVYLLTEDDAARLDRTEGVPHVYVRDDVDVVVAGAPPGEARRAAFVYRSPLAVPGRKPSARYLGLLLDGARAHGLPDAYIRQLEAVDLAVDERAGR